MTCCRTTNFTDFHIGLTHPCGGLEEFVIRETYRCCAIRAAIGADRTMKVAFCHDAAIYSDDDRGRLGLEISMAGAVAALRAEDLRAVEFHHYADLY